MLCYKRWLILCYSSLSSPRLQCIPQPLHKASSSHTSDARMYQSHLLWSFLNHIIQQGSFADVDVASSPWRPPSGDQVRAWSGRPLYRITNQTPTLRGYKEVITNVVIDQDGNIHATETERTAIQYDAVVRNQRYRIRVLHAHRIVSHYHRRSGKGHRHTHHGMFCSWDTPSMI
jgi:hypothetical protein